MSLDGQEPIVLVRFAAGLDGYETGAETCCDRGVRNGGELQVAIAVADAGNGGDDSGGSGAEGFAEFSGGVRGKNFVDRDLALFGGDAQISIDEVLSAHAAGKNFVDRDLALFGGDAHLAQQSQS